MVLREFVSFDVFSPGWVSVRLLAWLSAASAAVASTLMWLNVRGFRRSLDEVASAAHDGGRGRDDSIGDRAARHRGRALLVRPPRQSRWRDAARDRDPRLAGPADRGARAPEASHRLAAHRVTIAPTPSARPVPHVVAAAARRRVARVHLAPRSGRAAAELRPAPRWRRVAGPGDDPADAARSGLGRRGHRHVSGEERCAIRHAPTSRRGDTAPSICSRTTASRTRSSVSAGPRRARVRPRHGVRGRSGRCSDDYGISAGVVRWPLTYPAEPIRGFLVTDRFHHVARLDVRDRWPRDLSPRDT